MEISKKDQKIFCTEHGKQEIVTVDLFGNTTEYILVCGDIIKNT